MTLAMCQFTSPQVFGRLGRLARWASGHVFVGVILPHGPARCERARGPSDLPRSRAGTMRVFCRAVQGAFSSKQAGRVGESAGCSSIRGACGHGHRSSALCGLETSSPRHSQDTRVMVSQGDAGGDWYDGKPRVDVRPILCIWTEALNDYSHWHGECAYTSSK